MEKFFTVDGQILAINQDCSVTVFATISEALVANPLCVLKARITYENMSVHGRNEQWYQNTKYIAYSDKYTESKQTMVGNWFIKNFLFPRGTETLMCDFVDPIGKVVSQVFKGATHEERITNAFLKIREMNNYESAVNYSLFEENLMLKQQIIKLKEKLGL